MRKFIARWALSAVLVLYANARGWRYRRQLSTLPSNLAPVERLDRGHLTMLAACLLWAVGERVSVAELGLAPRRLRRSLGWGAFLGATGGLIVYTFILAVAARRDISFFPEWTELSRGRFLRLLFGPMLITSSVFEEIAFRGLLHAKLADLGDRRRILVGGLLFAAWHLVIAWFNLSRSGLSRRLQPLAYVGLMAVLTLVGSALGILRQTTGHVAGGILVHWLLLIGIALGLLRSIRRGGRATTGEAAEEVVESTLSETSASA